MKPRAAAPIGLHLPHGSAAADGDAVAITPETAGWRYTGLRVLELAPGAVRDLLTGPDEMVVLPIAGSCVVEVEGRRFDLEGRANVFERVTDFAYLPIDAAVRI